MNAAAVFRGQWIRESLGHKKGSSLAWWNGLDFGEAIGEAAGGFVLILLALAGIAALVVMCVRLIRNAGPAPGRQAAALMTGDSIHFTENDVPVESFSLREIREIRILQDADEENFIPGADTLPAVSYLELTLRDARRRTFRFSVGSRVMDTQLHQVIQCWRKRIAVVTHLRNGMLQPA